jgi:hypothetical protein
VDRRTNSPEGSGRASATVVTSRAASEELADHDQVKPVESANGSVTDGADTAADATAVDAVPPLPADNLTSSRNARPKAKDSQASFGRAPGAPAAGADGSGVQAASEPTKADRTDAAAPVRPPESPATPPVDTTPPTVPSGNRFSGRTPSGTTPSSAAKPDTTTVPPASFAWEMPEPPSQSPSSPARAFLRSDASAKTKRDGLRSAAPTASTPERPAPAAPVDPPRSTPLQTAPKRSVRQAHLTVARIEPWSVMKFSFVVSLVAFVILFVAVSVLYGVLSGVGVFDSLQRVVSSVTSSQGSTGVNAKAWFSASRVLGYTALLGSLNIVLITAMSTIGSVIYNLTSRLVGGVEVTLRETE